MDAEFLKQTESVYHAALDVEESQRAIFLREACGGDEALLREVESLLGYGKGARDFLEAPALELAGLSLSLDEARLPATVPVRIGNYRILRLLGEGGMGVVYEAEQEHPRRMVALKIIRPGLATPELLRRFEQEARALALQHTGDFMKQLKKTKRPLVLTVKGKAAAIVQDAEAYQRLLDIVASAEEGIRQGLEDVKQGKVRPAREYFADFEAEHGIRR